MPDPTDELLLDTLPWSTVRSPNCLRRAGITTLAQLARLTKREVSKIPGIGGVYLPGFLDDLAFNGIDLRA